MANNGLFDFTKVKGSAVSNIKLLNNNKVAIYNLSVKYLSYSVKKEFLIGKITVIKVTQKAGFFERGDPSVETVWGTDLSILVTAINPN